MTAAKRGEICPQCHQLHLKCLAHFQTLPDRPCNHKPKNSLAGSTGLCSRHGGRTIAKRVFEAKRKLARDKKIATYLHQMDVEPVGDPMVDLELAVAESKAIYEFYRDDVAQMTAKQQRYQSKAGIEQLRSETALMERALERYMKGLETLQKLRRADSSATAGETLLDLIKSGIDNRS